MDGMARPSNDGVHLETPLAQTGSSSEGVRSATSGNTPCATSPAENSIPGPTSIDDTKEAELASEQPVSAARSAGATTSHAAGKLDRRSNCHKSSRLCHNTRAASL